jgi:LacI family transcriptional regulator
MSKATLRKSAATKAEHELDGRKPTINDIARLANVSKKTVSRVINRSPFVREETRARVNSMIEQFGYIPDPQARGLAFRRSFLIGLVYDNPNAPYVINIQEGILTALRGSDFELVVHPTDRRGDDFIPGVRRFIERQKLHGVITLPPISEIDPLAQAISDAGCGQVRIAAAQLDDPSRMVVANDRQAVTEVAEYLVSLGHRRIGFITGPSVGYRSARERRTGFLAALEQRGIKLPAALIVEGRYTFESGVACGEALLSRKSPPTAIFASNDEMAAGVYRAAYRLGVTIPREVSVVGYDDSPMASRLSPQLTTVRQPIRDMGRLAASKLLPRGVGNPSGTLGDPVLSTFVDPHLVVRDSCQPPRA